MKDEKVNEIINAYGKVLEEYAGYMAISEKRLSHSKKDIGDKIQKATVYLDCWTTAEKIQELKSRKAFFTNIE